MSLRSAYSKEIAERTSTDNFNWMEQAGKERDKQTTKNGIK